LGVFLSLGEKSGEIRQAEIPVTAYIYIYKGFPEIYLLQVVAFIWVRIFYYKEASLHTGLPSNTLYLCELLFSRKFDYRMQ